ncbi:hypothetical protein SteCoe_24474 [Stentor coeruleus]|uniref:Condensin complex subunit 2 n=1 Tax=Stentor coeruleus TaxID=5963 RepID=A0A1R2BHG4_9CILI|nr:hypothetical protein SteCoe_24474 [Stentor coeruleus]
MSSTQRFNQETGTNQSYQASKSAALSKFTNLVELLHSNKVSKTNAFENRMVNFISDLFKSIDQSSLDSESIWQRYSTGIDSCAKVYGFCVDYLHSETYKILGGLNRTGKTEKLENQDEEETKHEKTKKKVHGGANTLENNIESITTNKFEKFEGFDPYFKVISSKFDASTASGLLLNNLSLNGCIDLVINEDDSVIKTDQIDCLTEMPILYPHDFQLEDLSVESLCFGLEKFMKHDKTSDKNLESILENMGEDNDIFRDSDSEASIPEDNLEVDEFENHNFEDNKLGFTYAKENIQERIDSLAERDDYNYFSNSTNNSWAGLDFWKKVNITEKTSEKIQRKMKEGSEFLLKPEVMLKPQDILAPSKKGYPNFFNDATLKKYEENNSNIPEDYGFNLHRLTQLFTRPRTQVKYLQNNQNMHNVIVESENIQNKDEDKGLFAEEVNIAEVYNEENIKYATVSKTVDIKLLKTAMWKSISGNRDKENYNKKEHKKYKFMDLINSIPNSLPPSEVSNLSIHSCFITLLHLANEHDLHLIPEGQCDFIIA